MVKIKIQKINEYAVIPSYSRDGDAGLDVSSSQSAVIKSGEYSLIKTGLRVKIPSGYEIQVRPRSGLAIKHGITALNSPGTIDSNYRGELCVILINHGKEDFNISIGDRIAQLVVQKLPKVKLTEGIVDDKTNRGAGGFGSSGK